MLWRAVPEDRLWPSTAVSVCIAGTRSIGNSLRSVLFFFSRSFPFPPVISAEMRATKTNPSVFYWFPIPFETCPTSFTNSRPQIFIYVSYSIAQNCHLYIIYLVKGALTLSDLLNFLQSQNKVAASAFPKRFHGDERATRFQEERLKNGSWQRYSLHMTFSGLQLCSRKL